MRERRCEVKELKPCPFCGGEVSIALFGDPEFGFYWKITRGISDNACTCRVFMESQLFNDDEHGEFEKKQLVEAWNRRASEQE